MLLMASAQQRDMGHLSVPMYPSSRAAAVSELVFSYTNRGSQNVRGRPVSEGTRGSKQGEGCRRSGPVPKGGDRWSLLETEEGAA